MSAIAQIQESVKANSQQIGELAAAVKALATHAKSTPDPRHPAPETVFGAPNARSGENVMGSRGFSFMKLLGHLRGFVNKDEVKHERDIANRLHKAYYENLPPEASYTYTGRRPGEETFLAPLSTSFMQDGIVSREFRHEMKSMVQAGMDGADPDEMSWIRTKQLGARGYGAKTLSWINELTGGALVAPPEFGEIIELLRAKEALVNAGARVVPLPPQGRIQFPRQTGASLTYWVGESQRITESDVGTGTVSMQAKKLAVLIKAPNELMRFASPAAEALLRDDMTKSLALGLDLAGLEGAGGDNRPRGVLNHPDVYTLVSSDSRQDGDRLVPEDAYRFIVAVEEANAQFEGFIMRPKTWHKYHQLRADAVSQGDKAGLFLFGLIRDQSDGAGKPMLAGYPVTTSTLVSQVLTKNNGSGLTYQLGGMWSDMLIGMYGALEFAATNVGDTPFQNDQTWIRGILSADVALRHEASFVKMLNLDLAI